MSSDLNSKKSWNPKSLRNQGKVWAREKEALDEFKKIQQRQEEINKTKEFADSGFAPKSKTSWIYDSGSRTVETGGDDDYLLGKRRLDAKVLQKTIPSSVTKVNKPETSETSQDPREILDKNDPMYKFKLEQLRRKELLELKEKISSSNKPKRSHSGSKHGHREGHKEGHKERQKEGQKSRNDHNHSHRHRDKIHK
ncbi:unnamed protein product [Kuraishia capsulata CBS 1993]|uniref:Pre-mRNA-splicing factor CWC25 n=1 Tax=Kuraishia capsulata CBS 1993 TaxID=1382522 RepID=W6MVN7_9ASCO|nr:uncharacterized protein KUCA_T00006017001 [Kuraishia capsulata CBS 1993]CDK30022.1 unnamed protein product [Kuraishia capsulata CBS 1993]